MSYGDVLSFGTCGVTLQEAHVYVVLPDWTVAMQLSWQWACRFAPLNAGGAQPPNLVVLPNRTLVFAGSSFKYTYAMLPQSLFLFIPVVAVFVVNAVDPDVVNE